MVERLNKTAIVLILISILMILIGISYSLYDFYNDYKCSTTKDINWFMKNNCMRYVEREIRNK